VFRNLLPRKTCFFDYFEQHGALTVEACKDFLSIVSNGGDVNPLAVRIKELEHQTDDITHRCIEELHKTFITPIDRGDIHNLIRRLDDIIDSVDAATCRYVLYEIREIRPEARSLAEVLVKATTEILSALKGLRNIKNAPAINRHCIAIYQFENEADEILRAALEIGRASCRERV